MFSGFYLALFIVLTALIVRGVSFEFRNKRDSARWRAGWDRAMAVGSLVPAFAWGVVFTDLVHGLRLSPSGLYQGSFWGLFAPVAIVGGLASLAMFLAHGATFLAGAGCPGARPMTWRRLPGLDRRARRRVLATASVTVTVILADRKAAALPAARAAVGSWVLGSLTSAEELAALGAGEWALAELAERERVLGARTRAIAAAVGLGRGACVLAGGTGLAGVAWAGAAAVRAGRISPVDLGVLAFLALGVAGLLQGLPDALGRLPVSRASLERLAGLGELPCPVAGQAPDGAMAWPGPGQAITVALRAAAAAYPHRPDPVIRGLDLELAPGRPVALAGPSGSGKTLVVLTLLRFTDLIAGQLTIDGADARALPPEQVRALLAWSPEQPALFPTSLRANLRVGAPHATDEQITDLLGQLGLGAWLDRLELGLDTVLAPWGHPVSGGELQRLSVARAVLADRPILLLDEPTSHLDAATADAVLTAVLERAADRSVLWVTHRPEELARFPEVLSLKTPLGRDSW